MLLKQTDKHTYKRRQQAEVVSESCFLCPLAVWNRIIEPVAAMRKEADMLRLFPEYLKGEELFGLTVHAVLRIAESVRKGQGPDGCWELQSC